jgi:hypothetical protein
MFNSLLAGVQRLICFCSIVVNRHNAGRMKKAADIAQ